MQKIFFFILLTITYFLLTFGLNSAQNNYYDKGIKLYKNKDFDKSKIFFEKDIVFNPRSEKSYLYLAKIFDLRENDSEQEHSLNNVLLLNPKNDEALYMLTLLKIKQSDYEKANELIDKFNLICKSFCSKDKEMREMLKKSDSRNE